MIQSPMFIEEKSRCRTRSVSLCLLLVFLTTSIYAQELDILIKNGRVIDPANNIDATLDVAIANGKIIKVAPGITDKSKKVIDATGLYVCPGLIDIHTHVFVGSKPDVFADGIFSLSPDDFTFRAGVTTVVDAGTSGWRNFPIFKEQVIGKSKTRILAFLNIVGTGMTGKKEAQEDLNDMDPAKASEAVQKYKDTIVGVRVGHYDGSEWTPFDNAIAAANRANVPLFVECHLPQYSLEDQLKKMRRGDIITHAYEKISERMPVVDEQGNVRPFVKEAQKKGILFDVGHGGAGFWFSQAIPALQQGLAPNSFGTDLHRFSMNAGMKDMLNVMSKYLSMGMTKEDIILRATWNAAKSIKRTDLGKLSEGSVADVAVLSLREGKFGFVDAGGNKIEGKQKFEAELTIREGKIVWDLNGISAIKYEK